MAIVIHEEIEQGTDEWLQLRLGLLTASQVKLIITPSNLKPAKNDKVRALAYELAAQRVNNYAEPQYIGDAMIRGHIDEPIARCIYSNNIARVREVGFITNDSFGFTIGYSPDGLVSDDGSVEIKSRCQKHQFKTIAIGLTPQEFIIQVQTGLLVTERDWCDFVSYCGGMPLAVYREYADKNIQDAIVLAAEAFEESIVEITDQYKANIVGMHPTERIIEEELV